MLCRENLAGAVAEIDRLSAVAAVPEVEQLANEIERLGPRVLRRALRIVVDRRKARAVDCPVCSASFIGQCPHLPSRIPDVRQR